MLETEKQKQNSIRRVPNAATGHRHAAESSPSVGGAGPEPGRFFASCHAESAARLFMRPLLVTTLKTYEKRQGARPDFQMLRVIIQLATVSGAAALRQKVLPYSEHRASTSSHAS
jgi:hypothetical protein